MTSLGRRAGSSLIDLLVAMAILALLFGGVYLVYFSIVDSAVNVELRTAATSVLNRQVEIMRNLSYDQIGTAGGVPAGVIPQSQELTLDNYTFTLETTVRNIDDEFDGTLGGDPNDTAPADYKLLALTISCPGCVHFVPLNFTTTIAPKNLESASSTGSLFINVFDALGMGVSGVTVRVVNDSVSPAIDLTDVTNNGGVLALVGVPTSTQAYEIQVSKSGYSSDQTYPLGGGGNPNPVKPHATVAEQTVTNVSFAIDRVSALTVSLSGPVCEPYPDLEFSIAGAKLIGTAPDVLKFSDAGTSDANGTHVFDSLEWDTYDLDFADPDYDIIGTIPFLPLTIDPDSESEFRFVLQPADPQSLRVTVVDAGTGAGVSGATAVLSRSGFSETRVTGRHTLTFSDWSGGAYSEQSGGVDAESMPGALTLLANASGTYPGVSEWLVSETIDLGGAASVLHGFSWSGDEPPAAGANSIRLELAANNDNATWSYIDAGSSPDPSLNGNRYVRYRANLRTDDGSVTPRLDEANLEFSSNCVPPYQVLFSGLSADTYDLEVSAPGYSTWTTPVTVGGGSVQVTAPLTP